MTRIEKAARKVAEEATSGDWSFGNHPEQGDIEDRVQAALVRFARREVGRAIRECERVANWEIIKGNPDRIPEAILSLLGTKGKR